MSAFLRFAFPEYQIVELAIRGIMSFLGGISEGGGADPAPAPQPAKRQSTPDPSIGARAISPRKLD